MVCILSFAPVKNDVPEIILVKIFLGVRKLEKIFHTLNIFFMLTLSDIVYSDSIF